MTDRRRLGTWALGGVVVLGVAGGLVWTTKTGREAARSGRLVAVAGAKTARDSRLDLKGVAAKLMPKTDAPPDCLTEADAAEASEVLTRVQEGYSRFSPEERVEAMAVAGRLLTRMGVDPAPPIWGQTLRPVASILFAGLADTQPPVRVAALTEIGRVWSWLPGLTPTSGEERAIDEWKQGFVTPAVRALGSRDVPTRASAVACLSRLPLDAAAGTAAAYVADSDPAVRQQALIGFAARRDLLGEEAILPLLHDTNPAVAFLAARTLKSRGLSDDLVNLGRLVAHPVPLSRASAIPQLLERTDIDPVVWLTFLSRDPAESVRLRAVEALGTRTTPEAHQRLTEVAQGDDSGDVRAAAARFVPPAPAESTVALPPLPGSAGLTPRAN